MIDEKKKCNDLTGKEWLQNSFSIWRGLTKTPEEKALKHPASFPVSLCEKLIHTFSKKNYKILDPFDGIGSTMIAAQNTGRYGIGIDLSYDFCKIAKSRLKKDKKIEIINGDSEIVLKKIKNKYFDLCITSPPYWDILNMTRTADNKNKRNYSNKKSDLGNIDDYDKFISKLMDIFKEVQRTLKAGGYCIINVMDIRKKSYFYPLHIDVSNAMQKLGFTLDDIIIWDRQQDYNNMRPLGYPFKFRINKVHEYLLIFLKG